MLLETLHVVRLFVLETVSRVPTFYFPVTLSLPIDDVGVYVILSLAVSPTLNPKELHKYVEL